MIISKRINIADNIWLEFWYDSNNVFNENEITTFIRICFKRFLYYDFEKQNLGESTKQLIRILIKRIKDEYPTIKLFTKEEYLKIYKK